MVDNERDDGRMVVGWDKNVGVCVVRGVMRRNDGDVWYAEMACSMRVDTSLNVCNVDRHTGVDNRAIREVGHDAAVVMQTQMGSNRDNVGQRQQQQQQQVRDDDDDDEVMEEDGGDVDVDVDDDEDIDGWAMVRMGMVVEVVESVVFLEWYVLERMVVVVDPVVRVEGNTFEHVNEFERRFYYRQVVQWLSIHDHILRVRRQNGRVLPQSSTDDVW